MTAFAPYWCFHGSDGGFRYLEFQGTLHTLDL
jgi:hypothetical protein